MNAEAYPVKVSVCIQTYNHERYIARALDSVLMQETDFDFEIIIGEDESSDGTREICIDYARRYPDRIRLLLRSREDVIFINGRPTGRYNFIQNLNEARGQYIALLDGDDYWTDPHKLQKQVDLLDTHPEYALCFHAAQVIDEGGHSVRTIFPPGRKPIYALRDLLRHNFIPALSVLFRNHPEFHPLPDWFKETPYADWPLHILNVTRGDIGYIDEVMGVYRRHAGGVSQHIYDDVAVPHLHHVDTLLLLRRYLSHRIDVRFFDDAISFQYELAGRNFAYQGKMAQARQAWKQALHWNKTNLRALILLLAATPGDAFFYYLQKTVRSARSLRH